MIQWDLAFISGNVTKLKSLKMSCKNTMDHVVFRQPRAQGLLGMSRKRTEIPGKIRRNLFGDLLNAQ